MQKLLTHADPWVTSTANIPNRLSEGVRILCPRGLAWVLPGQFKLILKLQQSGGAEMPIDTEIYFGLQIPSENKLVFPVGTRLVYHPWADLSLSQQRDKDFDASLTCDLGMDFLPVQEEEALLIQLFSSQVIDTALVRFQIPYFEENIAGVSEELSYRAEVLRI